MLRTPHPNTTFSLPVIYCWAHRLHLQWGWCELSLAAPCSPSPPSESPEDGLVFALSSLPAALALCTLRLSPLPCRAPVAPPRPCRRLWLSSPPSLSSLGPRTQVLSRHCMHPRPRHGPGLLAFKYDSASFFLYLLSEILEDTGFPELGKSFLRNFPASGKGFSVALGTQ